MSDSWLSHVTVPFRRQGFTILRLKTQGLFVLCDQQLMYFYGDPSPATRVTWPAPPGNDPTGFCLTLQADFPGTQFGWTLIEKGMKMPLTPGTVPPGVLNGC